MNDISTVQKYIYEVTSKRDVTRYVYCPRCPESDLCMMPWSDGKDIGLFCLFPNCTYRTTLGATTIKEMEKYLKIT